jgi:hypothetical protein
MVKQPQCGQKGSPLVVPHRMRLNVSRASSSGIRIMRARLNVRAAPLSKKCCDKGPILVRGIGRRGHLCILRGAGHDFGGQSRGCDPGAGGWCKQLPAPTAIFIAKDITILYPLARSYCKISYLRLSSRQSNHMARGDGASSDHGYGVQVRAVRARMDSSRQRRRGTARLPEMPQPVVEPAAQEHDDL